MTSYHKRLANLSLPEFYQSSSKIPKCNTVYGVVEVRTISVIPDDSYDKLFDDISHHGVSKTDKKKKNGKTNKKAKKEKKNKTVNHKRK